MKIERIKKLLNIKTEINRVTISKGLKTHMIKHNHSNMIKYLEDISYIIENPDYVGRNPRVKGISFECVKILEDNVLVAIKIDEKKNYFYVASVCEITNSKLKRMIETKRVIPYN